MLRRDARLRREYIFRRSLAPNYRADYKRKRKVQEALDSGKQIPTNLKKRFSRIEAEIKSDDVKTSLIGSEKLNYLDDEYGMAGIKDPKVIITTCRDPTNKLMRFVKEMRLCIPNSIRVNRGNLDVSQLVKISKTSDFSDLIIFHENSGICDGMIICHLPYGPTAYYSIMDVIARHDLPKKSLSSLSEQTPHLMFNNFNSKLGIRCCNIIKYIYPIIKPNKSVSCRRLISYSNNNDFILFRHHIYKKLQNNNIKLIEIGPRFTMRLYQIKLGTIDQKDAPIEWVLRPYFNTSWKRKAL